MLRHTCRVALLLAGLAILFAVWSEDNPVRLLGVSLPCKLYAAIIVFCILVMVRTVLLHEKPRWSVVFRHPKTFLFCLALIVYLANGRPYVTVDTVGARYLPLSIIKNGDFYLDRFPFLQTRFRPALFEIVNGHRLSAYPVGAAVMAVPIYAPAVLLGVRPETEFITQLEKVSASIIVALSAAALYMLLQLVTSRKWSLFLSLVYAFGTSSLSMSSQALFQHGASQLALTVGLYCLLRGAKQPAWTGYAGFPLAFSVVCRPTDAVIVFPIAIYVLLRRPRQFPAFAGFGLAPVFFQAWYNSVYFHGLFHTQYPVFGGWTSSLIEGLSGILISPGRGLFVFSPFLIFSAVALARAWRRSGDLLLRFLGIGVLLALLVHGKWPVWWGGSAYGPRMLSDLTPILTFALYDARKTFLRNRIVLVLFCITVAVSVAAHSFGIFASADDWRRHVSYRVPQVLWRWSDNPLIYPAKKRLDGMVQHVSGRSIRDEYAVDYVLSPGGRFGAVRGGRLIVDVTAINQGSAAWQSVSLKWCWRKRGSSVASNCGDVSFDRNVAPGQSWNGRITAQAPDQPGLYSLFVSLIKPDGNNLDIPMELPVRIDQRKPGAPGTQPRTPPDEGAQTVDSAEPMR